MPRISLALFVGCLVVGQYANGALVSRDWQMTGDGLLTFDSESGLEWLDLTVTSNMSVNQVTSAFANELSGFRYALPTELDILQIAAGLPAGNQVVENEYFGPSPYIQPGLDLIQMIGSMIIFYPAGSPAGFIDRTTGWFDSPSEALRTIAVSDLGPPEGLELTILDGILTEDRYNFAIPVVGSYLVRDTAVVPLPGAAGLLASALVLLGWFRRRQTT